MTKFNHLFKYIENIGIYEKEKCIGRGASGKVNK